MTKFYTMISYTEGEQGYIDRCGDYIAGVESECTIQTYTHLNLSCLIDDYAKLKLESDLSNNKKIIILFDGLDIDNLPSDLTAIQVSELETEFYDIEDKVLAKYLILKAIHNQKIEDEKQKILIIQQEKQRIEKQKNKDLELQQLALLKAKYKDEI